MWKIRGKHMGNKHDGKKWWKSGQQFLHDWLNVHLKYPKQKMVDKVKWNLPRFLFSNFLHSSPCRDGSKLWSVSHVEIIIDKKFSHEKHVFVIVPWCWHHPEFQKLPKQTLGPRKAFFIGWSTLGSKNDFGILRRIPTEKCYSNS